MIRSNNSIDGSSTITTMRSLINGLSYVMDLINEDVQDHHQKTAYLSYRLAEEMDLPMHARQMAIFGGLLHDIGSVLEHGSPSLCAIEARAEQIAFAGEGILKLLPTDTPIAEVVRYTQTPFDPMTPSLSESILASPDLMSALTSFMPTSSLASIYNNMNVEREVLEELAKSKNIGEVMQKSDLLEKADQILPEEIKRDLMPKLIGQVVHLADIATLMFDNRSSVLNQVKHVQEKLHKIPEGHFHPLALEAFDRLCQKEAVWMDLLYQPSAFLSFIPDDQYISLEQMALVSEFASVIIDFRSPFTAMHSAGVSATAVELAKRIGMSGEECLMMKIAGNVHDIGKLKIPTEILEKPGKLTDEEFNIVKEHAYYTYKILNNVSGLERIAQWAAFHHEKLNGRGYPFHVEKERIHLGARILAVADIFSAITEDRPYRKGMEKDQVIGIMKENADRGDISEGIVRILIEGYDEINEVRAKASKVAGKRYYESMASRSAEQPTGE